MRTKTRSYYQGQRGEMLKYLPDNIGTSLEIGCGHGNFSAQIAKEYGAETWGIEPSDAAKKAGRVMTKVFNQKVEEAITNLPSNKFDVIVCNDVLEHLYDPYKVLEQLKPKLKKRGRIVASLPNLRYFWVLEDLLKNEGWNYGDAGVLDFTHVRFFTHKTMKQMFEKAGYKVELIEGINPTKEIPFKYKVFNFLMRSRFWDTPYIQFAIIAIK